MVQLGMFTNFERESSMSESERDTIRHILQTYRTIATVGLSSDEEKPAYIVPDYLQSHGYRIIPVNPGLDEALGEKAYASLSDIPEPVEVVQLFLRSERVGPVVDEAIAIGAKAVWMQLGIADEDAAARARAAGLEVVMNQCMKVQHKIMTRS
jgi:predicted CoA-binding protein